MAVLSHEDFRAALAPAEVSAFGFAQDIHDLDLDTLSALRPVGSATDLTGALRKSAKGKSDPRAFQGILLVSDGAHNLGEDPLSWAAETEMPVFCSRSGQRREPPGYTDCRRGGPGKQLRGQEF